MDDQSCLQSVLSDGEVECFLLSFEDSFGFLVRCESSSDGSSEFSSEENSSLFGVLVKGASGSFSLLLVEGSEVSSDVFADSLDLGQFGGACAGSFGIS